MVFVMSMGRRTETNESIDGKGCPRTQNPILSGALLQRSLGLSGIVSPATLLMIYGKLLNKTICHPFHVQTKIE
jgi:hypothetical protein